MNPYRARLKKWRQQMTRRLCSYPGDSPSLVVMSQLTNGPVVEGLIEVQNLTIVTLHEERGRRHWPLLRLAGHSARLTPDGVKIGGAKNCVFHKDVSREPQKYSRDQRLDLNNLCLLDLALRMEGHLHRNKRHPHKPRRCEIPFPPLVAGFRNNVVRQLALRDALSARVATSHNETATPSHREYFGLQVFPINESIRHLDQATAVFADLTDWPHIRTIQLLKLPTELCGRRGPIEYDLCNNNLRRSRKKRRRRSSVTAKRYAAA